MKAMAGYEMTDEFSTDSSVSLGDESSSDDENVDRVQPYQFEPLRDAIESSSEEENDQPVREEVGENVREW